MTRQLHQLLFQNLTVYGQRIIIYLIVGIGLGLSMIIASIDQINAGVIVLVCWAIGAISTMMIPVDDIRQKSFPLILSLPVRRSDFVKCRYIGSLLHYLLVMGLFMAVYQSYVTFISSDFPALMTIKVVILLLILSMIQLTGFLYSTLRFERLAAYVLNLSSFVIPGFLLIKFGRVKDSFQVTFLEGELQLLLLLLAFSIVAFYISYRLSRRHFEQKDI